MRVVSGTAQPCNCPYETADWNGQPVTRVFHEPGCPASGTAPDYGEMVTVGEDDHGDIRLSLYSVLQGEPATRTDEVVLRPSQAERLAAELLAYANGDHRLPPDAIRPQRIVEATETPE